jgi:hypothetical protein
MKRYIHESVDKFHILNSFVNRWVTTTSSDREKLAFSYVNMIAKFFPESKFSGTAYRTLYINPSYIEHMLKSVYVVHRPTEKDKEIVKKQLNSSNIDQQQAAEELLHYWNDVTEIKTLIPNGNRIWWKGIRLFVNKHMSGRYTSWSEKLDGTKEFQKIVDRANRIGPIQFQGAPQPWPITINATVSGISLVVLSEYISNSLRQSEILATTEIVATPTSEYEIVEQKDPLYQLLPIEYSIHN